MARQGRQTARKSATKFVHLESRSLFNGKETNKTEGT